MSNQVEDGTFRRDLYHRLRVGHIVIPALRQRPEDLVMLTNFFLERESQRKKKNFSNISPEASKLINNYAWNGNVRELENAIERAVLLNTGPVLKVEHLDFLENDQKNVEMHKSQTANSTLSPELGLPTESFDIENHISEIVQAALQKFDGNKSKTAQYLGISRYALMRRLQKDN